MAAEFIVALFHLAYYVQLTVLLDSSSKGGVCWCQERDGPCAKL